MQVDEDLAAQQRVHRVLARRVHAHELLQRRRLVGAVVVDVHVGVPCEPLVEEVDQRLERPALLCPVVRPDRLVSPHCAVAGAGIAHQQAKEEVQTARRLPERIALDIEDDVARRGPR